MVVNTPCLCTREDVKRAADIKETARNNWQIDRAIQSATQNIVGRLHRRFFPIDATYYFDWPGFQCAYPWGLWLNQHDLVSATAVTTGGQAIPLSACNLEPVNSGPPYTRIELRRDLPYAFGVGSTPQRNIAIAGTWGYWNVLDAAGALAAAVATPTAATATVTDASLLGVGQILVVDSERMLIADRSMADTGQTNLAGATTALVADNAIGVADGTQLHVDEIVQIDSERMLVVDVTGSTATVKRAWDGTVLAVHTTGSRIYALRNLALRRGQLGTAAAAHSTAAAASVWQIPSLLRDLAIAEAGVRVTQEVGGYSNPEGSGGSAVKNLGAALPGLWDEAKTAFGRQARQRVI